ncbi:MAG: DNA polymerase IV [bacterium]|nr:DNA polymerase IV [bacterium]
MIRAIVHVDGDAFFASCEIAQNERLRGKPVVTGQEKGMAIALSYEAKALGVSRGMLMSDIRKLIPNVIIMPGNYDLYKVYSRRMYKILQRHAAIVEEYSIDECFGILEGESWKELVAIAHKVQQDLHDDLGMTFSLGLAPTKTLAKVASKWKKPAGFTAMQHKDIDLFLEKAPIGAVWGVGRSMSLYFQKLNITTALEFIKKSQTYVEEHFAKPYQEMWYELRGVSLHKVRHGSHEKHQSIRATRTFRPPSTNKAFILSELSKNAEKACLKLRRNNLKAKTLYFYLKTQEFRYFGKEIVFTAPISVPSEMMNAVEKEFDSVFKKGIEYRASGIVLHSIRDASVYQADLFNMQAPSDERNHVYTSVDQIFNKFGRGSIFIASSLISRLHDKKKQRDTEKERLEQVWLRMGIPYWGEGL